MRLYMRGAYRFLAGKQRHGAAAGPALEQQANNQFLLASGRDILVEVCGRVGGVNAESHSLMVNT